MAKVPLENPKSFLEFVKLIDEYQRASTDVLWYRGCGISSYKLIPSLYRHKTIRSITSLAKLEHDLMVKFRQRSIPFHSRRLDDNWDAMFFMQHYRVPTRLLDWTENPFIALYFALTSAPYNLDNTNKPLYSKSATVWILNPTAWNRHALSHQRYDGGVLAPGDDALNGYKPTGDFASMNKYPVALYGTHNSPRIVAQRGVFTVFGQTYQPMENIFKTEEFPKDCLVKINFKARYIGDMRLSIFMQGITESVVFPDLDGLAQEIKRNFGFEV